MKKYLAVLMAVVMLLSLSVAAFAADVAEYSVDDVDEDLYDGTWVTVCDVFDMYLPSDWIDVDLDQVDLGENTVCAVSNEDATHMMLVQYFDADTVTKAVGSVFESAEDLAAELVKEGYEDASVVVINDMEAVAYTDASTGAANVVFIDADGAWISISFTSFDDDFADIYNNIAYSICETEGEDAEDAA